ncbi:MAG: hypothetical protein M1825_006310 [Sarcosagium campestre]|nr:MAG: hypothetical protein M1825_006310 [Sarcosagium campestre]
MAIPNSRDHVPPPLPPPRHIEDVGIAWKWGNDEGGAFGQSNPASVRSGSSLSGTGSFREKYQETKLDFARRASSTSTIRASSDDYGRQEVLQHPDEGYDSLSNSALFNHKLRGEEPLRNASQSSVDKAYDKSLLDKLDVRSETTSRSSHTSPRNFRPASLSSASPDTSDGQQLRYDRRNSQGQPLSALDGSVSPASSSRTTASGFTYWNGPADSAVSPGFSWQSQSFTEFRSPARHKSSMSSLLESEFSGRDSFARSSVGDPVLGYADDSSHHGSRSHRGSYDQGIYMEPESEFPMEEAGMRHLNLGDRDRTPPKTDGLSPGSKTGQKRRASSPPRDQDDRLSVGNGSATSDLFHRRVSAQPSSVQRGSPVQRHVHGSVSSTSSAPRNGSFASSAALSVTASSTTSLSSIDRHSPSGTSPSSELDAGRESPYVSSVNPSPRGSISRSHQRNLSDGKSATNGRKMSGDGPSHAKSNGVPKLQGGYICECCPKKPKKFENLDDLRVHEMEKQYTCQYCHNRFKNKNEAERHQNSLHLRRHSWSCAQLSGVEAAFHPSPHRPSVADVCGYCGEEFALPADWDARFPHLTNVHKFGECNQTKKFFRADHFRQHLKHSHAGTSGKWTNMLENACMKDEPMPERVGSVSDSVRGSVIDEVHDES